MRETEKREEKAGRSLRGLGLSQQAQYKQPQLQCFPKRFDLRLSGWCLRAVSNETTSPQISPQLLSGLQHLNSGMD